MNNMPRVPNNKLECLRPDSENGNQPIKARHQSRVVIIACLALALGCVGLVQQASAHQGFDPEIAELTEDLTKDPDNVELLIRRGQVYRSYGKFIESLQDLEQAWLLDRENRTVALQRALTLSAMGRNEDAEAVLDYFLQEESDPNRVVGLAERATIRARTGRVQLAIGDLTSAIQLQPTIELYLLRGQLQESLGALDAAAAGYQEGLIKLGNAIVLKKHLIRVQIAQQQYGAALALIDEELARSPVKTPWYLQRAELLAIMGQPDASRLAYEQALAETNRMLAKRPTTLHLIARAKILHAMGQQDEAVRDLQEALNKSPGYDEAEKLLQQWSGQ